MSWFTQKPGNSKLSSDPIFVMGNTVIERDDDEDFHLIDGDNSFENSLEMTSLNPSSRNFPDFYALWARIPWISYRKDFPPIGITGYTSDAGWGCLPRSGQMMLAHLLLVRRLKGRRWAATDDDIAEVLTQFADHPESPYSIHNLALAGAHCGKPVGQWFAPSTFGLALECISKALPTREFSVYCPLDGVIYLDHLPHVVEKRPFDSLFVLLPLRLGIDSVSELYYPTIRKSFALKASVGIVGGRPGASLYFAACQADHLLYLDPHTVQPTADFTHKTTPLLLPLASVDPSLAFGFYIDTEDDLQTFIAELAALNQTGPALFAVETHYPSDSSSSGLEGWD